MADETLKLSRKRAEYPVEIDDLTYHIREMTGKDYEEWVEFVQKRTRYDEKGNAVGMMSLGNMQAKLISKCLIDPTGKPVTEKEASDWPTRMLSQLFLRCQEVNGLTQGGVDEAKKD